MTSAGVPSEVIHYIDGSSTRSDEDVPPIQLVAAAAALPAAQTQQRHRLSWCTLAAYAVAFMTLVLTVIDLSDAVTAQRMEFEQHMHVLNITNAQQISKISLQLREAEYFTRRSQCAMIVLRVWRASIPYRLYDECAHFAQTNTDSISRGIQLVFTNTYTMLAIVLVALLLVTRFAMHVYAQHIVSRNMHDLADTIVHRLQIQ